MIGTMENAIENATNDIPEFSLCGQVLTGKIVEMYDADTCKIVLPLFNGLCKFTCRLNGIDTPEMKPRKDKVNREAEIINAKKARNEFLRLVCPDSKCCLNIDSKKEDIIKELTVNKHLVTVKCLEFDKYGRLLVEITPKDGTEGTVNDLLVKANLAVPYNGGTKTGFM
jgi:endonuclease YncB( thermonuclease family)